MNAKKILKKSLRVVGWIIGSLLTLFLLIIAALQIPAIQNKITQKAITFLEEKIGTNVSIESIYISFPKNIVVKGLYLEDQRRDTLLYTGKLSVDTDLWALTKNEIELNKITIENFVANVKRAENDSLFNFSYIINAFVDDSTASPDTLSQKEWRFSLEDIHLEKIRADYADSYTGNFINVQLGNLDLEMDKFDLQNNIFEINNISLENSRAEILQTKLATTDESAEDTASPAINLKEAFLSNILIRYQQKATGDMIRLDIGETEVIADAIDIGKKLINLNEIRIENTFISLQKSRQEKSNTASSSTADHETATTSLPPGKVSDPWNIEIDEISLSGNSFQFYDHTRPHKPRGVDFDHLWLSNISLNVRDIFINESDIKVDLDNFSFQEKSGFALKNFQSRIRVSNDTATIDHLFLETIYSKLQMVAGAGFNSLDELKANPEKAIFAADINQSYFGLQDLLFFNPNLADSLGLKISPASRVKVDIAADGSLGSINFHHANLKAFSDTDIRITGNIVGLPDMKNVGIDLVLNKFYTTKKDIFTILPDTLLPDSIAPPEWINVNGSYQGKINKGKFKTVLSSAYGLFETQGQINLDSTSKDRGIKAELALNEFDLGELLMQPQTIGKLDLQASLTSRGLTPKEMSGELQAQVNSFEYNSYRYKNLKLDAEIKNNILIGKVALQDDNLNFELDGNINYTNEIPHYNFTFDLQNADLKELNLSTQPLKFRGTLDVNMATADMRVLNGQIGLRKVAVFNGDALYAVDSLLFASIDQEGRSEINIDSDIMKGTFEGSINIFELPAVLREYFNTYYSLHDSVEQSYEDPQHFTFDLELKKTELITDILLPQLKDFEPGEIKGFFDSKDKRLELKFDLASMQYQNIGIRSLIFSTNSNKNQLNYNLVVDKIYIDSTRIDGLEFNGTVANDSILTNIILLDSIEQKKYLIGGTFYSREKEFELQLDPKQIILNYVSWDIPTSNYLRFGGPKLIAKDVVLTNGREQITIASDDSISSPIKINFRELNLEYLASMAAVEKPVSGLLDGNVQLYTHAPSMTFTSDISIKNFSLEKFEWGDIALAVKQNESSRFDVDFSLEGAHNRIEATGYYTGGDKPEIDVNAKINKFNLSSIQPLVDASLQDLKGDITGNFDIKGTPSSPSIIGDLTMRNSAFFSNYLKTAFQIKDETISLTRKGIQFNQFQLEDASKNAATLNGLIATSDYQNFEFKLDLITNRFQLLNTTKKDNDLFYGKISVNANARIRGTMVNPSVDMELSLNDGDHLTYIIPQSEASVLQSQGIVRFVDKTFKDDPFMKKIQPELKDTIKTQFRGIDLTAKVELSDKESFTIIIDPTSNDQLTVKGNTTLTLQMDQTGDLQLSGRYEISEGTYNLSFYKFLKREFQIEKGSTMTWSGDPMNAAMDIRAIYEVETSPIDLLIHQENSSDPNEVNRYKQRLPFQVYLNLAGELLKPDISFKLEMPMEERNALGGNVYARLQDINTRESDLNKQVFALLILKRFISDNPFESQGGGFEGTARTSVSKILTEQLNRLSENVKGIELSFDVKSYEDYSSGEAHGQTQLELGLSKSLFNDRLIVKVSGNVDVEGEAGNRKATDYIGDLALEYLITDDGRFRITGFRNSNYDMIDGELIETGAGLIYIKDYNTLRELFKANAKTGN